MLVTLIEMGLTASKQQRCWYSGWILVSLRSFVLSDPRAQVNATVSALRSAGAEITTLWYDIEPFHWHSEVSENQNFLKRMIAAGEALNVKAGVYSD